MQVTINNTVRAMLVAVAIMYSLAACRHEPPVAPEIPLAGTNGGGGGGGGSTQDPCDPNTVYFQQDVLPLFISSCAMSGCHDAITMRDGVNLSNYAAIMGSDVIDISDPWDSDVIEVITETDPSDIMPPPPNEPMTSAQIATILTWIQQGAQNNSCENVACDTVNVTWTANISPLLQNKCTGCHSGATPSGGHDLTQWSVANALATAGTMGAAIQHQSGVAAMPPSGGMLPQCEIDMILAWINNGAPLN